MHFRVLVQLHRHLIVLMCMCMCVCLCVCGGIFLSLPLSMCLFRDFGSSSIAEEDACCCISSLSSSTPCKSRVWAMTTVTTSS